MVIRNVLEDYWRKIHTLNGYQEVKTPVMLMKNYGIVQDTGIIIRTICIQQNR